MKNKSRLIYFFLVILACGMLFYWAYPIGVDIYTSIQNYHKRIATESDYTKKTTPLPRNVRNDICLKFEIIATDARCSANSTVYAPDFFPEIKNYLEGLPAQSAKLETVRDKLDRYLVICEDPNQEGRYRCIYDLRGDGIYPIYIYFTKDGFYYRIIANTSGS